MASTYEVRTNNQEDNVIAYNFSLTKDLLKKFQSRSVSKITLRIDGNNVKFLKNLSEHVSHSFQKYQMTFLQGNNTTSFDCTVLNEKANTELYRLRRTDGFTQIGNIRKKVTCSAVSKNMHQRIEKKTEKSNRKTRKIRKLGTPKGLRRTIRRFDDEGEDGDEESDDDSDEDEDDDEDDERAPVPPKRVRREVMEEEEEVEEEVEDNFREARQFLDSVEVGDVVSNEFSEEVNRHKQACSLKQITNFREYYSTLEEFHKKYEVYAKIDLLLKKNSETFSKLVEYHENFTHNKELKELFKEKIDALHLCRENQVIQLHETYVEYHEDIRRMKSMIEHFAREEKKKE